MKASIVLLQMDDDVQENQDDSVDFSSDSSLLVFNSRTTDRHVVYIHSEDYLTHSNRFCKIAGRVDFIRFLLLDNKGKELGKVSWRRWVLIHSDVLSAESQFNELAFGVIWPSGTALLLAIDVACTFSQPFIYAWMNEKNEWVNFWWIGPQT